ncbi:unnamed protein product, partial [Larinioides sclopetarius]
RAKEDLSTCKPCLFSSSWWPWWCALLHNGLTTIMDTMLATMATWLPIPMPITTMELTTQLSTTSGRNEQIYKVKEKKSRPKVPAFLLKLIDYNN